MNPVLYKLMRVKVEISCAREPFDLNLPSCSAACSMGISQNNQSGGQGKHLLSKSGQLLAASAPDKSETCCSCDTSKKQVCGIFRRQRDPQVSNWYFTSAK